MKAERKSCDLFIVDCDSKFTFHETEAYTAAHHSGDERIVVGIGTSWGLFHSLSTGNFGSSLEHKHEIECESKS